MKSNKQTVHWTLNTFTTRYAKCVNNNFNSHTCSNFKTFIQFRLPGRKQRKWTWSKKLWDIFWTPQQNEYSCEHSNEPSGTIKRWDTYWLAGWLSSSQKLYSIEYTRHKHVKVSTKMMLKILHGKQRMRNKICLDVSARFLKDLTFQKKQ
jgi:hypothetical protein